MVMYNITFQHQHASLSTYGPAHATVTCEFLLLNVLCLIYSMAIEVAAKRLEYQMNVFMKNKKKKDFQPSYFTRGNASSTHDDLVSDIEQEHVRHAQKKKTWKTMLKCDQWALLQTYMKENNIKEISMYKQALVKGSITVVLDEGYKIKSVSL